MWLLLRYTYVRMYVCMYSYHYSSKVTVCNSHPQAPLNVFLSGPCSDYWLMQFTIIQEFPQWVVEFNLTTLYAQGQVMLVWSGQELDLACNLWQLTLCMWSNTCPLLFLWEHLKWGSKLVTVMGHYVCRLWRPGYVKCSKLIFCSHSCKWGLLQYALKRNRSMKIWMLH